MMNRNSLNFGRKAIIAEFDKMTEEEREKACLIVSHITLPEKIKAIGDPYEEQLIETARFNSRSYRYSKYEVGWQSVPVKHQNHGLDQMFKI